MPAKLRNLLIILTAIVGFIFSAYAIWWWQYKDMRTFSNIEWQDRAIKFQGDGLRQKLKDALNRYIIPEKINVINFVTPGCACNKFNTQHVKELSNAFGSNINFINLIPNSYSPKDVSPELKNVVSDTLLSELVPAAPAAAVIDKNNELVYFGPYSTGVLCGEGDNLVEARLRKLLSGEKIEKWLNTRGYGCFCEWK